MKKTHILVLSVHASINMYIYVYVDPSPNLYFSALFAISPNPVPGSSAQPRSPKSPRGPPLS